MKEQNSNNQQQQNTGNNEQQAQNVNVDERDAKIKNEPDTARLRSERQSVIDGRQQSKNEQ